MNWLKRLQNASFRGIQFLIDSSESSFSRRIATDVFPGTDRFYSEDISKNPASFQIEGFLVGSDYDLTRNTLIEACSARNPGILIHPYLGQKNVHCQSLSVTESKESGGMARIVMSFIEVGDNIYPRESKKPSSLVKASVEESNTLFKSNFLKLYSITGLAKNQVDAIRESIKGTVDSVKEVTKLSEQGFRESVELANSISNLNSDIDSIISSPEKIAEVIASSLSIIKKSGMTFVKKCRVLSGIITENAAQLETFSENSSPIKSQLATLKFISETAVLENVLTLSGYIEQLSGKSSDIDIEPISEDSWRQELGSILTSISEAQLFTKNIYEYDAYEKISGNLLKLSESDDVYTLPNLFRYIAKRDIPFLVAVFQMYGNIDKAKDVMQRNKLEDAYYVKKGMELVYLK